MAVAPLSLVFVCSCGHEKRSHRPHGGRRVPVSGWVCRKKDCPCEEYGSRGVTTHSLMPDGTSFDIDTPYEDSGWSDLVVSRIEERAAEWRAWVGARFGDEN